MPVLMAVAIGASAVHEVAEIFFLMEAFVDGFDSNGFPRSL